MLLRCALHIVHIPPNSNYQGFQAMLQILLGAKSNAKNTKKD